MSLRASALSYPQQTPSPEDLLAAGIRVAARTSDHEGMALYRAFASSAWIFHSRIMRAAPLFCHQRTKNWT
jgi:hypothetical protein